MWARKLAFIQFKDSVQQSVCPSPIDAFKSAGRTGGVTTPDFLDAFLGVVQESGRDSL